MKQPLAGVILEPRLIPDVLAQDVERLVPRLLGHFENVGPIACGACEKSAAQAVSGIPARIQRYLQRKAFDDQRHALIREPRLSEDVAAKLPLRPE